MAKADDIVLDPAGPFGLAAARAVRIRTEELFAHAPGVLDTADVERVHDMRVASRRLRAALELFSPCFPRRAHRSALRDVKALADALGERRDPDVHLEALGRFAAEAPELLRPGVEEVAARQRQAQAAGNVALAAALDAADATQLQARLLALADSAQEAVA